MKKTLWIAIVGALAASVVAASAQEVLSANAVGYIKKTLPADAKFIMVTVPLNSMTESSNLFGRTSIAQEAPQGSTVYFWNSALQQWDPAHYLAAEHVWVSKTGYGVGVGIELNELQKLGVTSH